MTSRYDVGLGTLVRRLVAALDGDLQHHYDEMGVSFRPRFFTIVQALRDGGAASVGMLVARCGVSQPAVTQTLKEMRTAGLIVTAASKDQRMRLVQLSSAGEQLCELLMPLWNAAAAAAAALDAELPAPLSQTIVAALAKLDGHRFADRIREEMGK